MRLLGIDLGGFRSFAEDASFDVGKRPPGLYSVTGANGNGKSTLFESVCWCLFGRTSRGLKAGSIKNWNKDSQSPMVVTSWEDARGAEGAVYAIRSWQPNMLLLGTDADNTADRPIEQKELEEYLHTSPDAFLNSIYFAQFAPSFVDISPAEQSAIFTNVLGLSVWEDASERASQRAAELESLMQDMQRERDRARGKAETLLAMDFDKQEREYARDKLAHIKEAREELVVQVKADKDANAKVSEFSKNAKHYESISKEANSLEGLIGVCDAKLRKLDGEILDLNRKDYKKCPTCGAPVTNAHIVKELHRVKKERAAALTELDKAKGLHSAACERMRPYAKAAERVIKYAQEQWQAEQKQLALCNRIERLEYEENPYTKQRADVDKQGEEVAELLEQLDKDIGEITEEIGYNRYWVQGFKELRLSVIRESLDQLTVETNECLFELGLRDWQIEFDVEHETKSGTVRKNFTTFISAPGAPEAVAWEAWSGGESQRLRLAVAMGFANLISSRSGVESNFEFWDEPSTWCDDVGINDMLAVLADRAERQGKRIFLADHRALDFGGFAGTITITKDSKGSHIHE